MYNSDYNQLCTEFKEHDIPILNHIFLPFHADFSFFPSTSPSTEVNQVLPVYGFGLDELLLKVSMDNSCSLWGKPSFLDGPSTYLDLTGCKIILKPKKVVTGTDNLIHRIEINAHISEKHFFVLFREL